MRLTTVLLAGLLAAVGVTPLAAQSVEAPRPAGGGEHHPAVAAGGEHRHSHPNRRHHGGGEHAGTRRPGAEGEHGTGGTMGPEDRAAAERRQREDSLGATDVKQEDDSATVDSIAP